MGFFFSLLAKLHDEFNQIRGAAHVPTQLHDLLDELVARFHALEAHVHSAPVEVAALPAAVAVETPAVTATTITVPIAPADVPPATDVPPQPASTIAPGILSMLTAGHENAAAPTAHVGVPQAQQQPDRRTLRDLSDTQGPAIVEGPAGAFADIACRRPAGSTVEITCGRVPSDLGACTSVELSVGDVHGHGGGSDATGSITFTSTGNDVIHVFLGEAGAVEVHRSY